jgi:GAF domain-containing protein
MGDAILRHEALFFESRTDFRERYPIAEKGSELEALYELSYACLPFVVHGRAVGGASLVFPGTRAFDEDERVFLTVLAHHAAQAVERASLFEREKATQERLRRLQQLTAALSSAATVEETAQLAARVITDALRVSATVLWATDERGDLHLLGACGAREFVVESFRHVPADSPLPAARVARERLPVYHESEGGHRRGACHPHRGDGTRRGVPRVRRSTARARRPRARGARLQRRSAAAILGRGAHLRSDDRRALRGRPRAGAPLR